MGRAQAWDRKRDVSLIPTRGNEIISIVISFEFETSGGAVARRVTVKPTGCGFDPHSRR